MRNYLDVLLEELLSCSKNSGIDVEIYSIGKKQAKLEFENHKIMSDYCSP